MEINMLMQISEQFLNVIFAWLLVAVSVNDIRKMEISNGLNLAIFLLGVAKIIMIGVFDGWKVCGVATLDGIVGLFIVSVPLAVVAVVTQGAIGGGDIKLLAASGIYLGCRIVLWAAMVGFLLASVYAAVWFLMEKKTKRAQALKNCFALGPFLCAGMIIASALYRL